VKWCGTGLGNRVDRNPAAYNVLVKWCGTGLGNRVDRNPAAQDILMKWCVGQGLGIG
jgi:hypothetical protein